MLKTISKRSPLIIGAFLPLDWTDHDKISEEQSKTAAQFHSSRVTQESGADRLKNMFTADEFGNISCELNATYQAGFLGLLTGVLYGGFIDSRVAYMNFMENNQATAFESHLDAKKKLQDKVTVSFAKGAWKWGWRLGLFTTSYVGIVTMISVYRGKSSIWEYLAAGSTTGAMYKMNMGLRGMASGGIVGLAFGGIAGGLSLGIMKATGTSMEDVRYWQYQWKTDRDGIINDAKRTASQDANPDPMLDEHDQLVGENKLSLDFVEEKEKEVTKVEVPAKK